MYSESNTVMTSASRWDGPAYQHNTAPEAADTNTNTCTPRSSISIQPQGPTSRSNTENQQQQDIFPANTPSSGPSKS